MRLNGAARKRLKCLLKQELIPEETWREVLKPIKLEGTDVKRPRSDDSTPTAISKRRMEVEEQSPSGATASQETVSAAPNFKQVLAREKVGIFHQSYPETGLTTEQMRSVQETILQNIMDLQEDSIKPKFLGTIFKAG